MSAKTSPIGICDHCGGKIRRSEWFTRRGPPRRYCSRECRNTANSRAGAPKRAEIQREYVRRGVWGNPRDGMTPDQISAVQSRAARTSRQREIRERRWRNPGLSAEARAINSAKNRARMSDPVVRAQAAINLRREAPDARTSATLLMLRASLIPDARTAWITYDGTHLHIRPSTEAASYAPKLTGGPYALRHIGDRLRADLSRLIRDLHIPAAEWHCVARGDTLTFERVGE